MKQNQKGMGLIAMVVLVVVVAAVGFGGWKVWQKSSENDTKAIIPKTTTENTKSLDETEDEYDYSNWYVYLREDPPLMFNYPEDFYIEEDTKLNRIYISSYNTDVDPVDVQDFQMIWISTNVDEASAETEEAIRNGISSYRAVKGSVKRDVIQAYDVTIRTYEYDTRGGPVLEAYWEGPDATRYMATNATEAGTINQTAMVATLKQLLPTIQY